jgi:hypothetical protein
MILPALALVLASATAPSTLSVTVVSLDFSYPYYGEPGNTCQRGSVYVRGVADLRDGTPKFPVVVRMVDSAGLTPGSDAVLEDVRVAGKGRDGTAVYCAAGRANPAAASTASSAPTATASADTQPPLVPAEPAATASAEVAPAASPSERRCTARLFNIVKKPLSDKKFGPSEFDPDSALNVPEEVDCSLARSRITNVLLVKMVKDGFPKPETVVGAEWGSSSWQKDPDAQRRMVKVYLIESAESARR